MAVLAIFPEVMSLPRNTFSFLEVLLSMCRPRLLPAVRGEGRSNVTHTSGKRGVVVSGDRSGSAVLGDATDGLDTAGREGPLTSKGQEVRGTPSRTYLRTVRYATRDATTRDAMPPLNDVAGMRSGAAIQRRNRNSVGVGKLNCYQGQWTKFCRLRFWPTCTGDGI